MCQAQVTSNYPGYQETRSSLFCHELSFQPHSHTACTLQHTLFFFFFFVKQIKQYLFEMLWVGNVRYILFIGHTTNLTSLSGCTLWSAKSLVYINTVDLHVHWGSSYWWHAGSGGFALQIQSWSDLYRQFEKRSGLKLPLGVSTVSRGSHKFVLIFGGKAESQGHVFWWIQRANVLLFPEDRAQSSVPLTIPPWIHFVSRFFHSSNPLF